MKRHPGNQLQTPRQISHREALELICATADDGHANGHWHGVAVKIARAALFGHPVELWEKDWQMIDRNAAPAVRNALPLPATPAQSQ
jgi:hypothetical protein